MNIKEVASRAGVSVTTVSRVLNYPEKVKESTREKVLSTMKELNYTPNWFARNIQNNRTNIVGVLVPDIMATSNMEIAKGVERIVRGFNCSMILCSTGHERETERSLLENLIGKQPDGLIFIDSCMEDDDLEMVKAKGIPYVFVGKCKISEDENLIYTNYEEATEEVVDYLVDMGRKRIAMILPDDQTNANGEKLLGFKKGLEKNHLSFDESMIKYADNSITGGMVTAEPMMESNSPDAILAATDTIAFGVLEEMKRYGLSPDDIGVVGFEGLEAGAVMEPKLTTVIKPSMRMGLMAGRLLFDLVEADECEKNTQIMLQSKIKIRRSCGNKERIREIW